MHNKEQWTLKGPVIRPSTCIDLQTYVLNQSGRGGTDGSSHLVVRKAEAERQREREVDTSPIPNPPITPMHLRRSQEQLPYYFSRYIGSRA